MAPNLDDLIKWLLNEVVSTGEDGTILLNLLDQFKTCYSPILETLSNLTGVSLSQFLAFIDAFHIDTNKQTRGAPGAERSSTVEKNLEIDYDFKREIWKAFTAHPDVLVGENKGGNGLDLSEIEALPLSTANCPSHPENPSSETFDLDNSGRVAPDFVEKDPENCSSPSAQLLGQLQPPDAQTLVVRGNSTTPIYDDAEVAPLDDFQRPCLSSESHSHVNDGVTEEFPSNSISHTNKMVDMTLSEAIQPTAHGSGRGEGLSVTHQNLTTQPRIFVSQERIRKTATHSDGTSQLKYRNLEPVAPPSKRRGRPPKVEKNVSPRRRGRPPKANVSIPMLSKSLALSIPQQTMTDEFQGDGNSATFESTFEHNTRRRRQAQKFSATPEPRKSHGKETKKVARFTSHDDFQRAAGIPGVYFDIAELEKTGAGRAKKRIIALFKSEKLKSLSWMKGIVQDVGVGAAIYQPVGGMVLTIPSDFVQNFAQETSANPRKRSRDAELEAPSDEPAPKKHFLDMVRGFGSSNSAPYKSPYLSSPATSYLSPYSRNTPRATNSLIQGGSLPNIQAVPSGEVPSPLQSATARASAIIPQYSSAYASLKPTSFGLSYKSSTSESTTEKPLSIQASQITKDYQLQAAIKSAGELEIPDVTIRLPSSKDGIAGNLCLSLDKKSLIFITEKRQTETAPMVFQISDIAKPPETSKIGSEPMVLRITTSSIEDEECIYHFNFLPTEDAFNTANNMRAKIVTAMMLLDLEDETETVQTERPFRCNRCDGAWKNWEGLKYHQTKSKTDCNPNYTPRKRRTTPASQDVLQLAAAALDILNGDSVQSQNPPYLEDSDDGAMEQRRLEQLMPTVVGIKPKDARLDPELQKGKDVIMALLNSNEHVFPGEKSLWFAFVAASLQKSPDLGLPSYGNCNIALDLLADTGQVRKVQFSFKDKTGLMKTRTLITRQEVDPSSAVVTAMKENIKAVFPEYYVPLGFAPPKVVQSMLEERQNHPEVAFSARTAQRLSPISNSLNLATEEVPETAHTPNNDTPSNKVTRSGRISRRPQRLLQSVVESSFPNLEGNLNKEDDNDYAEDFANRDSMAQTLGFSTDGQRKRRRAADSKGDIHGSVPIGMRRKNSFNDLSLIPLLHTLGDDSRQVIGLDRPQFKRRKIQLQSAEAAPDCKAIWQPAPTYLQGKNGAWNNPTQPQLTLTRKKYAPRAGLPEPVTYMQTLSNSTWSFRPYGHGVRPIHARPSKRAEGQTAYLTRIQHGFRPVMMPNGDIFIPTMPSSNPIEKTSKAANEGIPESAGSTQQKRKYSRQPSNIPQTQEAVTEVPSMSAEPTTKKRKYTKRRILFTSETQVENPLPTTVGQEVEASPNVSVISRPRTSLPEDESRGKDFSILSCHDPVLDVINQTVLPAAVESGAESCRKDDKGREGKPWDPDRRAPIAQYMMTARRLTALPADLEGIQESLATHPDLKVEVAVDHQHSVRKRTGEGAISPNAEYRLIVAVVVIRTLTGGLDKQIDWVLVSKLFPHLPMNAVSKRWPNLHTKHKHMIERLETDFQLFFLEAYERGEINPIDYDHLVDYDWDSLVSLVLERIDISPSETTTQRLPASRDILNQVFTIENVGNNKTWRDEYFSLLPPIYRRMEQAASEQSAIPITRELPPSLDIDQFTVAKSWARANTLTPSEIYDRDFAVRKLATIGNGVVAAATSALFESKVLMQRNKGRPTPNRGVEITDTFAASLRKHLDETHLIEAVAFKAFLDAKFHASEVVMAKWAAKDGEILAITNLQAHGRIKLEPKGVPMNKFGLTGGGYQTKKMDKKVLHFDLQILPTPSYIYDADIPILSTLTTEFWPPRSLIGAIPVWYDIAENLIPAMWKKVLCVVLATIAMRPGALLKELVRIFNPALEEWEMRILVDWGLKVGALTVVREGYDGWNVAEWWWVIGGWA